MNKPVIVELSIAELIWVALAGVLRQVMNLKEGRKNARGLKVGSEWQIHIQGCLAEYAVAKYMGRHWHAAFKFRAMDGDGFQIRSTLVQNGHLLLNVGDDDPAHPYVLVVISEDYCTYRLCGWAWGREVMDEKHHKTMPGDRGCEAMPQEELRNIDTLIDPATHTTLIHQPNSAA